MRLFSHEALARDHRRRENEYRRKKRSALQDVQLQTDPQLQQKANAMHQIIQPAIMYFGTPVVLITTVNEDGSNNLAPMSSAWWLGQRCALGLDATSETTKNLVRTGECVLNLPSMEMVAHVNRIARTTGSTPVPEHKRRRGYRFLRDKFVAAGLTATPADIVTPPLVEECPVQLEAHLASVHPLADEDPIWRGRSVMLEVAVRRVHVDEAILLARQNDQIDPDKWRPLIMSFQQFYGLAPGRLLESELAKIPESVYLAGRSEIQDRRICP